MTIDKRLQQYYQNLSGRDQLALVALTTFLALVMLLLLVLIPAWQYSADARDEYRQALTDRDWLAVNQSRVGPAKARRDPGQSLLGIANSSAKPYRLEFKRFEPVGDNGLNLWLDNVSFNQVIRWLEELDKDYGVRAGEIALERRAEGLVNVRLMLQG